MPGWPEGEVGPVQVLVLGIDARGSGEMISAELQDLGNEPSIRVIDLLRVRRGADGAMHRLAISDPSGMPGTLVEALLFTAEDRRDPPAGQPTGPSWFLADRVPRGSTVAILLVEHRWAIPLRAASREFDADVLGDAWLHPRDIAAARRLARQPPW
ncbi:MAG: hypothetical protein JST59_26615 [Actinobacteria bacterium]|nr:hypothetical protein [Actinomycetota bacterium]